MDDEIREAMQARHDAYLARRARLLAERSERAERRKYGLAQRHARKLRGTRGHRRGRGPLSATQSPDPDVPRGTDTPDAA